jgi:hypothetical protein
MKEKGLTPESIATDGLILRSVVGSTVHGLAIEGTDDRDEMGVCIEPPERVFGLQHFDHYIKRDQPEGVRSQPGDLDLVIYSLRKFVGLATAGNPSILNLLFAPPLFCNSFGQRLLDAAPLFASRAAGPRFLGYLKQQRERLLGTRGQMRVTRTELIEKYGFDTKYAMHMVRLGFQGREFLTTGKIGLGLDAPTVEMAYCRKVREGKVEFGQIIEVTESLERDIMQLLTTSPLPRVPDFKKIDRLLVDLYLDFWKEWGMDVTAADMKDWQ